MALAPADGVEILSTVSTRQWVLLGSCNSTKGLYIGSFYLQLVCRRALPPSATAAQAYKDHCKDYVCSVQHHLEPGLPQHTAQLSPQYQAVASAASQHKLALPQPSAPVAIDVRSKSSPLASVPSFVPVSSQSLLILHAAYRHSGSGVKDKS